MAAVDRIPRRTRVTGQLAPVCRSHSRAAAAGQLKSAARRRPARPVGRRRVVAEHLTQRGGQRRRILPRHDQPDSAGQFDQGGRVRDRPPAPRPPSPPAPAARIPPSGTARPAQRRRPARPPDRRRHPAEQMHPVGRQVPLRPRPRPGRPHPSPADPTTTRCAPAGRRQGHGRTSTSRPLRGSSVATLSTYRSGSLQRLAARRGIGRRASAVTPWPMTWIRSAAAGKSPAGRPRPPSTAPRCASARSTARPIIARCQATPRGVSVSGWVHGTASCTVTTSPVRRMSVPAGWSHAPDRRAPAAAAAPPQLAERPVSGR